MKLFLMSLFPGLTILLGSQVGLADYDMDREAIKAMAGCFQVTFQYTETETADGVKASKPYRAKVLEYVDLEEREDGSISLQHILKVAPGFYIKHWSQDWVYEDATFLKFVGAGSWQRRSSKYGNGVWLQKVSQVDDSPRYQCESPWSHKDGMSSWSCDGWAPLPRREYTKRDDYNVMARGNLVEVTNNGWQHKQQNKKLLVLNGELSRLLGREVGLNDYKRVKSNKCSGPASFWKGARQEVWGHIKTEFRVAMELLEEVRFSGRGELTQKLNRLAKSFYKKAPLSELDSEMLKQKIRDVLQEHIL